MFDILHTHTVITMLLGSAFSGVGAATVGAFIYFKQQGTMGDVISHASFPGVMIAFLLGTALFANGRDLTLLTVFALATGFLGALTTGFIQRKTPLGAEVSMVATIALYFSCGMLLLALISASALPGKGGISDYLLGSATHLTNADTILSIAVTCGTLITIFICFRPLTALVFDPDFARISAVRVGFYERLLFVLLAAIIVTGMRTVGLLLIVAFVVMPAASARQWCRRLPSTVLLAALLGAAAAVCGTLLSVTLLPAPTGALIVLLLFICFIFSLLFAPERGAITLFLYHARHRSAAKRKEAR